MHSTFFTASVAVLFAFATSHASTIPYSPPKLLNASAVIPSEFKVLDSAVNMQQSYTIAMHLVGQDEEGLEAWLEKNAGQNVLTEDELANYISPSQANLDAITSFLRQRGVSEPSMQMNSYKNKLTVTTTTESVSTLFKANFNNYLHEASKVVVQRTKQYMIPGEIANAVHLVTPLTSFTKPPRPSKTTSIEVTDVSPKTKVKSTRRSAPMATKCYHNNVSATCIRQYYGTYDYQLQANAKNMTDILVLGLINQNFSQSDLNLFLKFWRPDVDGSKAHVPVITVAGAINSQDPADANYEGMLDMCTTTGMAYPLKSIYYSYGGLTDFDDPYQLAFQDVLDKYDQYGRPGVLTTSYENLESSVTLQQATVMCKSVAHLSALGTTVVAISGDWGVGGLGEYQTTSDPLCPPFQPVYPSTCQYVLSVGGTQDFAPERVINTAEYGFESGAGVSNYFERPSYQRAAFDTWHASTSARSADGFYNVSGRAYPDLSAQAANFPIAMNGTLRTIVGGTSAAAPIVASIIALLNNARKAKNKPNVGWVNPLLYLHNVRSTKDITIGNVTGCPYAPQLGFQATTGWDPASGWGTPLFDKLRIVFDA